MYMPMNETNDVSVCSSGLLGKTQSMPQMRKQEARTPPPWIGYFGRMNVVTFEHVSRSLPPVIPSEWGPYTSKFRRTPGESVGPKSSVECDDDVDPIRCQRLFRTTRSGGTMGSRPQLSITRAGGCVCCF